MFKKICLVVAVMLSVFLVSCTAMNNNANLVSDNLNANQAKININETHIKLNVNDGSILDFSEKREKPIFINFWFSTCGPCIEEFPDLQKLYDEYKEKMDFIFIDCVDTKEIADNFIKSKNLNLPVGYDEDGKISEAFNIIGTPTTFIYDVSGNQLDMKVGARSYNEYKQMIENSLK